VIRVLLVDDHAVVRAGYRRFLEGGEQGSDPVSVVAEAANAEAGYSLFREHAPDVSVVDLSLAGAGGFELIRRMIAHQPLARALVFSMHDDAISATRALRAGARGYVTKHSAPGILVDAVRQVHAGRSFLSPDIAQRLAIHSGGGDPLAALSAKEFEVFRLIAEGRSIANIAAALSLSQKTVANYQALIKDKLGAGTTAALVHLALRHGLIAPPS